MSFGKLLEQLKEIDEAIQGWKSDIEDANLGDVLDVLYNCLADDEREKDVIVDKLVDITGARVLRLITALRTRDLRELEILSSFKRMGVTDAGLLKVIADMISESLIVY